MRLALLLALPLVAASAACMVQEDYVGNGGVVAFAMTVDTPPYLAGEEESLYWVETRVEYPIRPPTPDEIAELMTQAPAPYPRMPWVLEDDLRVEVDLVVTNLMEDTRRITLTINGFNEFHEYFPGAVEVDDELIVDYSMWERTFDLGGGQAYRVTVREREMDEIEYDLASVVNGAPNPQMIVFFQNQYDRDPRSSPYVPEVVPGLTGFRLGIRAGGASNIVVEASLRIRDMRDRLSDDASDPDRVWVLPVPEAFMPPAYEE